MMRLCCLLILASVSLRANSPFTGRWDLTVTTPTAAYPGWMEIVEKDGKLEGRMQPRAGSVRPLSSVTLEGSRLTLTLSPPSGKQPAATWVVTAKDNQLMGVQKRGDTVLGQFTGVPAPALRRPAPKAWTNPEPLFNGKDLTGWEPDHLSNNHWVARDGTLLNEAKGANLRTTRKFDDFKLHIEFNCPDNGNSGVYLRGRYEIQVEYEPAGTEDKYHMMGAIYGFVAPAVDSPRTPGQWESFDVTLVGRYVTIARNGVTTVDNQEIPGITGGALDSNEGQPGPFYIQGDHTGGMKYRNITISLPKR
jgi:3-keto-disaccharide hydrolase